MGDNKIMSFKNFKENLSNDFFCELKKIYVEKDILSCYGSFKIQFKFKLDLNESEKSEVIYSLHSSGIMKNDEYSENEMKEKSSEFKTINEINEDNQHNLEGYNISNIRVQNLFCINNANSDNCFIEMQLYIGKNLLVLFSSEKKLIMISTFAGKNNINDYYLLNLIFVMKFEKIFHLIEVKSIILEIENFDNIQEYISYKNSGNTSSISKNNSVIYQSYGDNTNNLNNDINKNCIRNQKNIRNNLKLKKINKNSNNTNINNDDNLEEEEEKEINTAENNIINGTKEENNGEIQQTKKLKKKDLKKKPIKVRASFEIEEIFKSFGFFQIQDYPKTILSIIILLPILILIIKSIFF